MGKSYRVRDKRLDRDVAVKALPSSFASQLVTLVIGAQYSPTARRISGGERGF